MARSLIEVAGTSLNALALLAFGNILDLAVLELGLHLHFPTTGAEKFLGSNGSTAVFTGLGHGSVSLSCRYRKIMYTTPA